MTSKRAFESWARRHYVQGDAKTAAWLAWKAALSFAKKQ